MSEKLPQVSGYKLIKALTKVGFVIVRKRGSHVVLKKGLIVFTVPLHKNLKRGTLHAILNQAELSKEELLKLL